MMGRREEVRACLRNLLERKGDKRPFEDADALIVSGRLDSLDVLSVVEFLEDSYGFQLSPSGFNRDDFGSVDLILDMVEV
jgi:acyl carrier protein